MGLDIFFKKVKKSSLDDEDYKSFKQISMKTNQEYAKAFSETFDKISKKLAKTPSEKYEEVYKKECAKLTKFVNYYSKLLYIGVKDNYANNSYTITPVDYDTFVKSKNQLLEEYYAPYISYFRKVNFLYQFFSSKIDDATQCAFVTKEDLIKLVSDCEKVLNAKKKGDYKTAERVLPTRAGLFFGSTNYDDWYYEDVKDVKREMKKLLRRYNDDYIIWVYFSW